MKAILFLSATLLVSLNTRGAGELPRRAQASAESYPKVDVIYDSVAGRAGERLRTIMTRPRGTQGKLPVIFVAGWLSCDSVEAPADTKDATGIVFLGLAQMPGFCLFRIDNRESETAKAIVPKTISARSWPDIVLRFVLWVNTTLSIPTRFTF